MPWRAKVAARRVVAGRVMAATLLSSLIRLTGSGNTAPVPRGWAGAADTTLGIAPRQSGRQAERPTSGAPRLLCPPAARRVVGRGGMRVHTAVAAGIDVHRDHGE